jgi:hypothetical protein
MAMGRIDLTEQQWRQLARPIHVTAMPVLGENFSSVPHPPAHRLRNSCVSDRLDGTAPAALSSTQE